MIEPQAKPCPFCGETENLSVEIGESESDEGVVAFVCCDQCFAQGPQPDEGLGSEEEAEAVAYDLWNKRAATDQP